MLFRSTKPNENDDTPGTSWDDEDLMGDYMKRSRTVVSNITGGEMTKWDEEIDAGYGSDSSTEEVRPVVPAKAGALTNAANQTTNRVGNVPQYFYDDLPHIGYDIDGKKVMRPATGDELDKFLEGVEDADGGWCAPLLSLSLCCTGADPARARRTTVKDRLHQQNVALTEEELDLIHRLAKNENPDSNYDPCAFSHSDCGTRSPSAFFCARADTSRRSSTSRPSSCPCR